MTTRYAPLLALLTACGAAGDAVSPDDIAALMEANEGLRATVDELTDRLEAAEAKVTAAEDPASLEVFEEVVCRDYCTESDGGECRHERRWPAGTQVFLQIEGQRYPDFAASASSEVEYSMETGEVLVSCDGGWEAHKTYLGAMAIAPPE